MPSNIDRLGKLNEFHMRQFAHVVGKLKSIPEADGTLLDQTMLIYGTGISDSNAHLHDDLPIALVGGRAAGIKGGRHIRYPKETPLTNLWLTVLDKMGVPVDKLGDSTGRVTLATVYRRRDKGHVVGVAARPAARRRDYGIQAVCRGAATPRMGVMRPRRVTVSRQRCTSGQSSLKYHRGVTASIGNHHDCSTGVRAAFA